MLKIKSSNHPEHVLFDASKNFEVCNACDHYAGNGKLILKSLELQKSMAGKFDITADLEDGAAIGNEKTLRAEIIDLINSNLNLYNLVGLRVHDLENPIWRKDLEEAIKKAGKRISHITVPKVKSAKQLNIFIKYLRSLERNYKVRRLIPVHAIIETKAAFSVVFEIARIKGLRSLDFGLMDLISDYAGIIPANCMQSPGQFDHHLIIKSKVDLVAAACASNLIASHNVTTNYNDISQTYEDAKTANKKFGFLRMWSIHPSQIKPILEAFKPEESEIQLACQIINAAIKANWAPISHAGLLHDRASYRYFWQLIKRAAKSKSKNPEELILT